MQTQKQKKYEKKVKLGKKRKKNKKTKTEKRKGNVNSKNYQSTYLFSSFVFVVLQARIDRNR